MFSEALRQRNQMRTRLDGQLRGLQVPDVRHQSLYVVVRRLL